MHWFILATTTIAVCTVEIILFHWIMGRDAGGFAIYVMGAIAFFAGVIAMGRYLERGE